MTHRRSQWWIATLLIILPLCLGMGFGGEGPTSIPEPQINYRAAVTDVEGKRVELTQFSIEGQTYVLGNLGAGNVAIPFAKIKSAAISQDGDKVKAVLALKDGQSITLMASPQAKAYGKTSYGNYVITLGEVTSIELLGRGE